MNLLTALAALLRPTPPPVAASRPLSPRGELGNLSANATAASVAAAIRAAEAGDVTNLFRLYRDSLLGDDLVQGCLNTRKLAVLAQPLAVMPKRRNHPDDLAAVAAVNRAIQDCDNWHDALGAMMDSCLWPVSVLEKVYGPAGDPETEGEPRLTWTLRRLEPVNPALLCFRHGYQGGKAEGRRQNEETWAGKSDSVSQLAIGNRQLAMAGEPPSFEPWLRLWPVNDAGQITWDHEAATRLEPARHVVYRGHLLTGFRDNWGGPMRAVLGWWLLRGLAREWWGRFQERYGSPFPVGKTNMQDAGAVAFLQEAFSLSTKIGGMVIGQDDTVELVQAANTGGAEGYRLWNQTCNDAISRAITGIEPSANPAGLNAGASNKAENVREDVRMFDQLKLGQALERQLFGQFLKINGLPGRVKLSFGGLSDADAAQFAGTLNTLSQAGFEPEDAAMPTLNDRLGMAVRRKAAPLPMAGESGKQKAESRNPTGETDAEDAEGDGEDGVSKIEDGEDKPATLRAAAPASHQPSAVSNQPDPTDAVVRARGAALAQAYRGAMAPFRQAVLASTSREDCLARLQVLYADWPVERLAAEMETALQLAAAAGAGGEMKKAE